MIEDANQSITIFRKICDIGEIFRSIVVKGSFNIYGGKRMDDSAIIDLYWLRSQDAITETNCKYGHYCNSIAYNILVNPEDAEERIAKQYGLKETNVTTILYRMRLKLKDQFDRKGIVL